MTTGIIYGLIAGKGDLPCRLIEHFHKCSQPFHVIAFDGQTPPTTVSGCDHLWVKLGTVGPIFDYFKRNGVTHLVLAGGIQRPTLSELSLDWAGTKLLTRIGFKSLGDDGLLSAIVKIFEEQGLTVVGADELLQDILVPTGQMTKTAPCEDDFKDIQRGIEILKKLGEVDVGQAAVIQQGLVLGLEAIEGTSELIERVRLYQRAGRGGILVKMAKPHQNLKVDLPTIGPETIKKMNQSGLVGIAVESGRSQIINKDETLALADQYGIFVYGF